MKALDKRSFNKILYLMKMKWPDNKVWHRVTLLISKLKLQGNTTHPPQDVKGKKFIGMTQHSDSPFLEKDHIQKTMGRQDP